VRRIVMIAALAAVLTACGGSPGSTGRLLHLSGGDSTEQALRQTVRANLTADDCAALLSLSDDYLASRVSPEFPDDLRAIEITKEECAHAFK